MRGKPHKERREKNSGKEHEGEGTRKLEGHRRKKEGGPREKGRERGRETRREEVEEAGKRRRAENDVKMQENVKRMDKNKNNGSLGRTKRSNSRPR